MSKSALKYPRFVILVRVAEDEDKSLVIHERFIADIGETIPSIVTLHFPHALRIQLTYNRCEKTLNSLEPLYKEFGRDHKFYMVMCYKGKGLFKVNVLKSSNSEIVYRPLKMIGDRPVIKKDMFGEYGFKFISKVVGPILLNGQTIIPPDVLDGLKHMIPASVTFSLTNGETVTGIYHEREGKFYGLLPFVKKGYVKPRDYLLFTCSEIGKFKIGVFDKSKYEKFQDLDVVIVEDDPSENEEPQGPSDQSALVIGDAEVEDVGVGFSAEMTVSNVNNSSHGVYIPKSVKRQNREWRSGEEVRLRTCHGEFVIGLVLSNGLGRFSAGWNCFARQNRLQKKDKLNFTLVSDGDAGAVFQIDIQKNRA